MIIMVDGRTLTPRLGMNPGNAANQTDLDSRDFQTRVVRQIAAHQIDSVIQSRQVVRSTRSFQRLVSDDCLFTHESCNPMPIPGQRLQRCNQLPQTPRTLPSNEYRSI